MRIFICICIIFCDIDMCYGELKVYRGSIPTFDEINEIGKRYGIPKNVLPAIAYVESTYGMYPSKLYSVYSQIVDHPSQLTAFMKIVRHTSRSIKDFVGSVAGAIGYIQVIPTTWIIYAQDCTGDGIRDPLNPYDNLCTGAYYFARLYHKYGLEKALYLYSGKADFYVRRIQPLIKNPVVMK